MTRNVVFYRGPSLLADGGPIIAVAGRSTTNPKTGPMVQTWILRADMTPIEAVNSGADASICGDCKLRGDGNGQRRSCYVQWWRAPHNIWKSLHNAVDWSPARLANEISGQQIRLGAYGDPAAVPITVWRTLLHQAGGWTGYTHQWRNCDPCFRAFLMASVDTVREREQASAAGWRTFRVRAMDESLHPDEVICPASDEAGHKTTCDRCNLCRGNDRPAKSVAIFIHGTRVLWFNGAQAVDAAPVARMVMDPYQDAYDRILAHLTQVDTEIAALQLESRKLTVARDALQALMGSPVVVAPPVKALPTPPSVAAEAGAVIGSIGGQARAAKLPPERRSEIASGAAVTRWGRPDVAPLTIDDVLKALAGGPQRTGQVAAKFTQSYTTTKSVLNDALSEGLVSVDGETNKRMWRLTEAGATRALGGAPPEPAVQPARPALPAKPSNSVGEVVWSPAMEKRGESAFRLRD